MECSIKGCPGVYEERTVVHTVRHKGEVIVIDHVPAEVCTRVPNSTVPLYEYA